MITVNKTKNGTKRYCVPLDLTHWRRCKIIYVAFLPKMFNLKLTMKKPSHMSKRRDVLHNNWPALLNNVKVMKDKGGKKCSRLKRQKRSHNWMQYAILDWVLYQKKSYSKGRSGNNLMKSDCGLYKSRSLFGMSWWVRGRIQQHTWHLHIDIYKISNH